MKLPAAIDLFLQQEIERSGLPNDFLNQIHNAYVPFVEFLNHTAQEKAAPLLVSLQGPQGAGKSTLCHFTQLLLEQLYGYQVAVISLDDFYLSHQARQELAIEVCPLLATRGVPGTHNLELAELTLKQLLKGQPCLLPRFNKVNDDPFHEDEWPVAPEGVSVILFEGWCNHAPVQSVDELAEPVNQLEAEEDADGRWRQYVNDHLAIYHRRLFGLADLLICLQIPDFDLIYQWRGLQEKKLIAQKNSGDQAKSRVMDEKALQRFIHHFERLTRNAMAALPQQSDGNLILDEQHRVLGFSQSSKHG